MYAIKFRLKFFGWLEFCFTAIFLFLAVHSVFAATLPVLTYNLEIRESSRRSVLVNITLENVSNTRLLCVLPEWDFETLKLNHSQKKISNFTVSGAGVIDPSFKRINNNSWLINTNKNEVLFISYKVSPLEYPEIGRAMERNFAFINGAEVFMYIREFRNTPVILTVDIPYEWKVATGLSFAAGDFQYKAGNYQELISHPLFMGTFNDIYFTYKNRPHFTIFHGVRGKTEEKLSIMSHKILALQSELFKTQLNERYYFFFKKVSEKRDIVSRAFKNSVMVLLPSQTSFSDLSEAGKTIGSSVCRSWFYPLITQQIDKTPFVPRSSNLWFWSGICDYYGGISMIRNEYWSEDEFINYYIQRLNELLQIPEISDLSISRLSYNISEESNENVYKQLKLKGEMICLLLDLKIRGVTKNSRNLDDVIRFMKDWFVNNKTACCDEDILLTINSVSSTDFTNFFDLYVDGNMPLPIKETWAQAGIFLESVFDTIPNMGRVILSRNKKIIELSDDSPFFTSGIKVGDKILSVNGIRIESQYEFNQVMDSLKVGKEVEVMIERDGLSILFSSRVRGYQVQKHQIASSMEETKEQIDFRKRWLYNKN